VEKFTYWKQPLAKQPCFRRRITAVKQCKLCCSFYCLIGFQINFWCDWKWADLSFVSLVLAYCV